MPHTQVTYSDPLRTGRHPFQTFMLVLCVIAGIPLIFGQPVSATLDTLLPAWSVYLWGYALTMGASTALIGSYLPRRNYATALTVERVGLVVTGYSGLAYATLIFVYAGTRNFVAACIVIGFGLSCLIRARDIGRIMHRAIQTHYQDGR